MNTQRIKMALIGCGSVSQRGLLPHLAQDDAREVIDLVAVCDIVEQRARSAAERFRVPAWFVEMESVLDQTDIDAVLIATPAAFHYDYAMAAIEAGKHVHLQKPMTTTAAEADRLIEAAQRRDVKLVASPGQMLSPSAQQLKTLLREGAIGKVYWAFASTAFIGHEHEPFRADNPVDPSWYYQPGGGPIYDMAAYTLHTLTGILGPVQWVTAMSGIGLPVRQWQGGAINVNMDDNTLLLLNFGENCFAVVGGHYAEMGRVVDWGFTGIYGSAGAFEITKRIQDTAYPAHVEVNPPILAQALGLSGEPNLDTRVPYRKGSHTEIQESHLWVDIRHLAECILKDEDPIPSGEHARHVIEIIEKGYLAAKTGQTQKVARDFKWDD